MILTIVGIIVATLWLIFGINYFRRRRGTKRTMVVLGSGGHTSEMFKFLSTLNHEYYPRTYVLANTDSGSYAKIELFESGLNQNYEVIKIPRSREVGQSYVSSLFSTIYSILSCYWILFKGTDLLLTNGPGTCVPVVLWTWIYKYLFNIHCKIILIESYACVKCPSLTAKMIYPFLDRYFVQWDTITDNKVNILKLSRKSKVVYTGRIDIKNKDNFDVMAHDPYSYVLVTVGSTKFDALIQELDDLTFLKTLKEIGYKGIHFQIGQGSYTPNVQYSNIDGFDVQVYKYINDWDAEVSHCGLVLGHAGAGTILDSLEKGKPIVVVANTALMSNHQMEISNRMTEMGYTLSCPLPELKSQIQELCISMAGLKSFPKTESDAFKNCIEQLLRE